MTLLSVQNLTKRFGGLVAVNDVSFDVEEQMVLGLIGPNGAGKTTVFNLITGNYTPTSGSVIFNGQKNNGNAPYKIVQSGIARTFQNIRLFQQMSCLENVLAGRHCRMKSGLISSMFHLPMMQREETAAVERCMQELAFVGLDAQFANEAGNLSYGNQRLLEIARALASDPKILILDEPAGGMNDQETAELTELIGAIKQRGITILLIEHDMNLVMKICDKLVVLEYGSKIAEGKPEEVRVNPRVIEAYLGASEEE